MRHLRSICMFAILFITGMKALFSYLDPGSGSLIVQLIIAAIVGVLATFRLWKGRLLSLLGIRQKSDDIDEDGPNSE